MNTRARSTMSVVSLGAVLALGAGCGAEDLELDLDEEVAMVETQQGALAAAVGCAAIVTVQANDAHTGALLNYGTSTPAEVIVNQVKWLIKNPSTTDCNYVELVFKIATTGGEYTRTSNVLATSLRAGYRRNVYWNPNYDSRTIGPRAPFSQRYDVNASLKRNGVQIRLQNLTAFFLDTGQY